MRSSPKLLILGGLFIEQSPTVNSPTSTFAIIICRMNFLAFKAGRDRQARKSKHVYNPFIPFISLALDKAVEHPMKGFHCLIVASIPSMKMGSPKVR